ncbi:MAG: septum formation inhibitor Maf [Gammaproteobacteria bacterium]|nr:septum formation inhibitor Maf [Gammaproteobacteria bacterium]
MPPQIFLASRSPRRRALLHQIGITCTPVEVDVDESVRPRETPADYVVRLALAKARAGTERRPAGNRMPVLAADTAVVKGGKILGKPVDRSQALAMLRLLSGNTHQVLTAVALAAEKTDSRLCASRVSMRRIDTAEAEAYWESGEPTDKAGGYAIQGAGAIFISHLQGSYSGVMGLPLFETAELLANVGIKVLAVASAIEE